MDFLPMPHSIKRGEGVFTLTWNTSLVLENTEPSALLYARMLRDAIGEFAGLKLSILRGKARRGDIRLTVDGSLPSDTYTVSVQPDSLTLRGGSDEALLHATMTLRQWVQRHGAELPAIEIEDRPDLPNRGYYLDCSRGRVPTLAMLKQYADLLCRYKINQWQLYIEHTYLFRDLSEAWREESPLTAEEIMELDDYCAARHIELVPSLSTFGHMYQILSTKTCEELCELPGADKVPFSFTYWGEHHTLNVSHPDAMPFIKGLIGEYMALFRSRKFNICCDETYDLGRGRSKAMAEEQGTQTLYVRHVAELCRWLLDQGVTPMFWGDIIWRHPETYRDIPEGTICLNWGYGPDEPEDAIRELAAIGATQYACPGVSSWNRWLPHYRYAYSNIRHMCAYAHRYGAIGLLNTDWGDYGHIGHPWLSLPGILYGAAFAWNAHAPELDEVNRAISFLAYGDRTGRVMEALTALSGNEAFDWFHAVRWIEADAQERSRMLTALPDLTETVPAANQAIDKALTALNEAALTMSPTMRPLVHAAQLNAQGARLFNEIGLSIAAREKGQIPHRDGASLASELEAWQQVWLEEWRHVSKESNVARVRHLVWQWADELRDR